MRVGSNVSDAWEALSEALAERLSRGLGAELARRRLTDRLLEFKFKPSRAGATEIGLVTSPDEAILSAGAGTRFELDGLPGSEDRIMLLARAIAAGGLSETIWPHRVRFELRMESGELLRGGTRDGLLPRPGRSRQVEYPPYSGNPAR